MEELTTKKIIEIHDDIINEYGGTGKILNEGTLELLVYKLSRENDVFRQASLILHTIAAQHPFFDGNKRTALVTAEKALDDEGYYLDTENSGIQMLC
ncbi:MAG: type II toxin-antitoxin system death-on-curing family toxin [Candidatus Methanoperedenaceae archaeon]|nr:type II toxin-antitoxin system death-on-curing family toxin [Candidatus Methanoperedenaceae archaeon]